MTLDCPELMLLQWSLISGPSECPLDEVRRQMIDTDHHLLLLHEHGGSILLCQEDL